MALKQYQHKRDFRKTPEPQAKVKPSGTGRQYVIHKHAATRLHYDLRLEMDGVLKSWAVPKGPSLDPAEKRLAVQVEDHPVDYATFEGVIPEGEYGGGTVMLWDRGTWQGKGEDIAKDYERGRLKFELDGEKLRGGWTLVRMHGGDEGKQNWLLIKEKDEFARRGSDSEVTESQTLSAASGRSMEQIAFEQDETWRSDRPPEPDRSSESPSIAKRKVASARTIRKARKADAKHAVPDTGQLPNARKGPQPETLAPQLATLVQEVPSGDDWLHEIKYDGYRLICIIDRGEVRMLTRNGNDWTERFKQIVEIARKLPVEQAILDGEVVVLNADGSTDFQALQNALKGETRVRMVYYVFDLPHCQGFDLTRAPLLNRKEHLRALLELLGGQNTIRFSDHIRGRGPEVLANACEFVMEGLVSKRVDSRYGSRRSPDWVKIKCTRRQEFVIGGYTDPGGARTGFGALLVGYYDGQGKLIYSGRVGTGFNERLLRSLHADLRGREQEQPAFSNPPTGAAARGAHWVRPELVCEVEFAEWTKDGILRHPSFQGIREDKDPRQVGREQPRKLDSLPDSETKVPPRRKAAKSTAKATSKPRGPKSRSKPKVNDAVQETSVAGVSLSNPDRVMYPEMGLTKLDLASYYHQIAPWILPYIAGRPLTLVRCPRGHQSKCFYQKHVNESLPETIRGIEITEKDGIGVYIVIDDEPGLISLIQLGVLELHPWGSHERNLEQPDMMIFDLDPGPEVAWGRVVETALMMRERLSAIGLESFVKTSGGKGLHVVVPLQPRADWEQCKSFARAFAESLVRESPTEYVSVMTKSKRTGRIYIDYQRNGRGATSVAPYSTRARAGAPVSMPIAWDELTQEIGPAGFTVAGVPARLRQLRRDPWAKFQHARQSISAKVSHALGVD